MQAGRKRDERAACTGVRCVCIPETTEKTPGVALHTRPKDMGGRRALRPRAEKIKKRKRYPNKPFAGFRACFF